MRIVLLVEGDTECYLPEFFRRWLNARLSRNAKIDAVSLNGVGNYRKHYAQRAQRILEIKEGTAVVGLIDFYGSELPYPKGTVREQYAWAKRELENQVSHHRFRQHFAVHETEAWLLSDPSVFPEAVRPHLPKTTKPESINSQHPPSMRIKAAFNRDQRKYQKTIGGSSLFRKLNPQTAYASCPHLKLLLDDLLVLASSVE